MVKRGYLMSELDIMGVTITLSSEFYIKKGIMYYKIYHVNSRERKPKKIYQSKLYAETKEVLNKLEEQKIFLIKEIKRRMGNPPSQN
ncbi:hypothetical protein [Sebaldella sp. S0638]|uniref:hypothetical protein n=1 Tax=Sebaldella sp. S0638 TaxID=2957809 RepID=UPI0020A09691|nr:hypothetical protein [Sebaldella sp. S0638]MCP1226627.1 hypothetical protein [Sebaldella sp. S0638]